MAKIDKDNYAGFAIMALACLLIETLQPGDVVWGVLYEVDSKHLSDLDRIEGGYKRINISITLPNGKRLEAQTYQSDKLTGDPVPFDWYKNLFVQGAREHNLPQDYIDRLNEIPSRKS
ncbi:MAG: gamma-glutamylcyclotransferase [Dethiobacteria bacterium]|jgi:gamma-glutamylcyclotransferase (GGCT)/AIG2-like uncharacterized protein YtfP